MFLRIVDVYLIFEHFQWKPKPIAIKINIDLEAISVKKKIYIYMAYFHPLWIKHSKPWPLITLKESKISGIMMSRDKNRLNLVWQFCYSDDMRIDRIHFLSD